MKWNGDSMNIYTKLLLCLLLTAALGCSLLACSGGAEVAPQSVPAAEPSQPEDTARADEPVSPAGTARYTDDGRRIITIGTWYDKFYVSKHTDIYDDPSLTGVEDTEETHKRFVTAQLKLDRIRELEQKYNVVLEYANLTYDGTRESIDTSIPEGFPDVDIYETDVSFGIAAALNGYAVSLEELGLQDTDVFNGQDAMMYLGINNQQGSYLFAPSVSGGTNAYPLAFNLDMLEAAGLENPQDLFDRGEWTWEVWRAYLKTLTQDTDGDGNIDVYGYSGYWTNMLTNLLLSNNAGIAAGVEQTLDSAGTRQVLAYIDEIYNTDKTARPWDDANWEVNNSLYAAGLSAFWVGADWLFNEQGGAELPFEIGVVPWPCGPAGDPASNMYTQPQSSWYFIPKGAEDPKLIYDVFFDWVNWYDGDMDLGSDNEWTRAQYMTERNYDYAAMMATRPGFDLWESLKGSFSILPLMSGELTPGELVDTYAQEYQAALDKYFKG
jgi:hypothetical protein